MAAHSKPSAVRWIDVLQWVQLSLLLGCLLLVAITVARDRGEIPSSEHLARLEKAGSTIAKLAIGSVFSVLILLLVRLRKLLLLRVIAVIGILFTAYWLTAIPTAILAFASSVRAYCADTHEATSNPK